MLTHRHAHPLRPANKLPVLTDWEETFQAIPIPVASRPSKASSEPLPENRVLVAVVD